MSALNIPKPWHPKCKTNPVSFGSDGKSRASLEIIVHVSLPSGAIPLLRFPEWRNGNPGHAVNPTKQTMSREYAGIVFCKKQEGQYGPVDTLMRQTRIQYPGATLGGRAGRYPICAVKGMS